MDLLLKLNVRMDFVRHEDSSVTPLVTTWLINFDGPHGHIHCFERNRRRGNDCTGSTVRRGGYLVAVLIHKKPAGLVPV